MEVLKINTSLEGGREREKGKRRKEGEEGEKREEGGALTLKTKWDENAHYQCYYLTLS